MILGSWYTMEVSYDITKHKHCGYAILVLVIFRMVWAFIGTKYALAKNCLFSPKEIFNYGKTLFSREKSAYAGHNPLGSLAIFAMLLLLTIQVVTGLFSADNDYYEFGPLYFWIPEDLSYRLTTLHFQNFDFLLAVIGLHIFAVFFYLIVKRSNLITPMFTGKKPSLAEDQEAIQHSKKGVALTLIIICIAIVYAIAVYAPQVSFF